MAGRLSTKFMRRRITQCYDRDLISDLQIAESYRRMGVSEIRPSMFKNIINQATYRDVLEIYHYLTPVVRQLYPTVIPTDKTIDERRAKSTVKLLEDGFVRSSVFIHPLDKPDLFDYCKKSRKKRRRLNRATP